MNEEATTLKFVYWAAACIIALGLIGYIKSSTIGMAESATEAHKRDQISYGKFSRKLWSKKTNAKYPE